MLRFFLLIAAVTALTLASLPPLGHAQTQKGFNTGPYLALEGGVLQADHDTDQVSGQGVGMDFEPTFGFLFGWNLNDAFSTELQGRYGTNRNDDRRIHIASGTLYAKWTFICKALTDFPTFRILPFVKGGMGVNISVLPGAVGSNDDKVTRVGFGPSFGGGIAFIWKKYFFFGVDLQEDLLFAREVQQTVNGAPDTLVYEGGFQPTFGAMGFIGVHY